MEIDNPKVKSSLRRVLARRLAEGQTAEALSAELQTRMSAEDAQALLTDAEALRRALFRPPRARWLAAFAYVWTALLIFQNIGILLYLAQHDMTHIPVGLSARWRIFALVMAGTASWIWRNGAAALVHAGVILLAFPVGGWIERLVWPEIYAGAPFPILSVSILCSYAAAAAALGSWWIVRRAAKDPRAQPQTA